MFIKKNSQQALEFLIIFIIVITVVSSAMFFFGSYLKDIKEIDNKRLAENFAQNIQKEIEILSRAQDGYYRELEITYSYYDINISDNILFITDLLNDNITYHFNLPGNFNSTVKTIVRDEREVRLLVFEKKDTFSDEFILG